MSDLKFKTYLRMIIGSQSTCAVRRLRWRTEKLILLAMSLFLFSLDSPVWAEPTPARPNIIFILSDDVGQGDIGCYGQKLIKTPNLDRMAAEGTRYTQAYSGTSICAPSRTSLMTGLHIGHSPVRGNHEIKAVSAFGAGQLPLPESTVTVAQILKSAGYATACTGKWGMGQFDTTGSPLKKGFDHFFGYNGQIQAHEYFPPALYLNDQRIELPENKGGAKKTYAPDLILKNTLDWVRAHIDDPNVVFLHAGTEGERAVYEAGHLPGAVWTEGYEDLAVDFSGVEVPNKERLSNDDI